MLRFLASMLLVSTYAIPAFSQNDSIAEDDGDFEITWGPDYRIPQGYRNFGYIRSFDRAIVQMSIRTEEYLAFQVLGEDLSVKEEKKVAISGLPKKMSSEGFYSLGSRYFWFYSSWDKKNKKELLYAQAMSLSADSFEGQAVLVNECGKISPESYFSRRYYNFFSEDDYNMNLSNDGNHMMISYRGHPEFRNDEKNIDRIGFLILDSVMNKVAGAEVIMPYTEEVMDNIDFDHDGKGNAFYLIKVYDGPRKEKKEDGSPNYHYELLRIAAGSSTVEVLPALALTKPYVRDIYIEEDKEGTISCKGFFSNDPDMRTSDGFFLTHIDSSRNSINENIEYTDFPSEMLEQLARMRDKRSSGSGIGDRPEWSKLRIRNVISNEDGSLIISGEEYYTYDTQHTRYRFKHYETYTITHYVYNDMVVMKKDAEGKIVWWHRIPKTQYGTRGLGGMSFSLFVRDNSVYLFYLDNDKNKDLPADQVPAMHMDGMGGILSYAKIDQEGRLTKKQLFDLRVKNVDIQADDFILLNDNAFAVRSYLKDVYKMIVFNVK